jgi:hypothetical protein
MYEGFCHVVFYKLQFCIFLFVLAIYLGFKYVGLHFVGCFTTLRVAGLRNYDLVNVLEESGSNPTEVLSWHLLEGLKKTWINPIRAADILDGIITQRLQNTKLLRVLVLVGQISTN